MAEEKQFTVRSSDGTKLYSVIFTREGAVIRSQCNCKAGAMNQMCKHKEGLLQGEVSLLADIQETLKLREMQAWLAQSELIVLLNTLREAEDAAKEAQGRVKLLRKKLAKAICG